MSENGSCYRIYLLTVWLEPVSQEDDGPVHRFHLTDPRTGKRYGFTTLEMLLSILRELDNQRPFADTRGK